MCKKDQKQRKKKEIRLVNVTLNNFEVGIFFVPLLARLLFDPHQSIGIRFGSIGVECDDTWHERRRETAMLHDHGISILGN